MKLKSKDYKLICDILEEREITITDLREKIENILGNS